MTNLLDTETIRRDFPILSQTVHERFPLVFLDSAASSQHPQSVIDAMKVFYESQYSNVHRGVHYLSQLASEMFEQARERVRGFIGAESAKEVIFTSGTTQSINFVAHTWGEKHVGAGDEILITELEHHANIVPWFQLAERKGAKVRFLPVTDEGLLDLTKLNEFLTPRTKIFAFAAVSNVLGTINPVQQLVNAARKVGAMTVVDAAQHVPHAKMNVVEWGADFVAFSAHKMLGPTGIGIIWGREAILHELPPFLGGGGMIDKVTTSGFTSNDIPARFEAGTPPIAEAVGLAAAIDYLEKLGMDAIHQHESILIRAAHEALSRIPKVKILGPDPSQKAGVLSFVVDGLNSQDICQLLDLKGFALRSGHHCAMPLHQRYGVKSSSRASFYLYNTLEEVERFGSTLVKVIDRLG